MSEKVSGDLSLMVKTIMGTEIPKSRIINHAVFMFRYDGIPIYSSSSTLDLDSIGALLAGAWQASFCLSDFFGERIESDEYFRFNFDTSSSGVYALPLELNTNKYYLGIIFKNEDNPALVKARLRNLLALLKKELVGTDVEKPQKYNREEYLFRNITDEEIDRLFSFAGR